MQHQKDFDNGEIRILWKKTKECLQHQEFQELWNIMNNLWELSFSETTLYFDEWDSFWEAISSWTTNDLKNTL